MPSRKLEALVLPRTFTPEEWIELAEERRTRVKPLLSRFKLTELGQLKCVRKGRYLVGTLRDDFPKVVLKTLVPALETQGIWERGMPRATNSPHVYGLWGLSRSGAWIYVQIKLRQVGANEIASVVTISEPGLAEIVKELFLHPAHIWRRLAEEVHSWAYDHRKLHEQVTRLESTFDEDDRLARLMKMPA